MTAWFQFTMHSHHRLPQDLDRATPGLYGQEPPTATRDRDDAHHDSTRDERPLDNLVHKVILAIHEC